MIGSEQFWATALRSHVAARRAASGRKYENSPHLHPDLREVMAGFDNRWPVVGETIIPDEAMTGPVVAAVPVEMINLPELVAAVPVAASTETINRRRGRPRRGSEGETLAHRRPWLVLGMSRASWYRRRGSRGRADDHVIE